MKSRLKIWIQEVLGITELKRENEQLKTQLKHQSERMFHIHRDYREIIEHVKFINKDFTVVADINIKDPSIVLVMRKRGVENIVKFYRFDNQTVEEVHRFLERFGQNQCIVDSPIRMRGPNYRW